MFSAVLAIKFIAAERRMTELVHPVTIPTSRRFHDVAPPRRCVVRHFDAHLELLRYMVLLQYKVNKLMRDCSICVG